MLRLAPEKSNQHEAWLCWGI